MKKCPKCGADNRPDSSACYNCFAPLANVQPTVTPGPLNAQPLTGPEKTQPIQPVQPQQPMGGSTPLTGPLTGPLNGPPTGQPPQANQQTVVGQPLGGQRPQPPSPYGPQPGPYGPPPQQQYRRREEFIRPEPVKSSGPGAMIAVIILALAIIGGGIFAYMKSHKPEDNTPAGVVRAFIRASDSGNKKAMRNCLTKGSQNNNAYSSFDIIGSVINNSHVSFGRTTEKEGVDYALKVTSSSNTRAVVSFMFLPAGCKKIENEIYKRDISMTPETRKLVMDFIDKILQAGIPMVTVLEDGKWKIDEAQSEQATQEMMKKLIVETMHISPQMVPQMAPQMAPQQPLQMPLQTTPR
ncbi:MAG: hypothetical protein ABFD64_11865 [Armatimonadota bacterium]